MPNPTPKAIASASSSPVAAGSFVDPTNGQLVSNGFILGKLAIADTAVAALSGGGEVLNSTFKITLDANGVPSAGQSMYGSDQYSSPVNPGYNLQIYDANGNAVWQIKNVVISGAAPLDLTTALATAGGVSYTGAVLLTPSGSQTITTGDLNLSAGSLGLASGKIVKWNSDTGLSRDAAGVVDVGNGAQGDKSGNLKLATVTLGKSDGTLPALVTNDTVGGFLFTTNAGKQLEINNSAQLVLFGSSSGSTILQPSAVASGAMTVPAGTDTLVAVALAQTLQNKILNGASSGNAVTLLNSQDTLGNVTGNGTDQTVYTFTIPANTVQAGKGINLRAVVRNNNAVATTYKIVLGSTTLGGFTTAAAISNQRFDIDITNNAGVQNAQVWMSLIFDASAVLNQGTTTSVENFANALTLKITANEANPNTVTPTKWFVVLNQ